MYECEECGSDAVAQTRLEGVLVFECDLCGHVFGDDRNVAVVLDVREAKAAGVHPAVYPLVQQLNRVAGLSVIRADAGDMQARTWPYVQMSMTPGQERSLESLTKSLALSNAGSGIHWVLELEYQNQLVVTLKPRFHREIERIDAGLLEETRQDLERVRRNLRRDMFLSWWRS